MGEVAPLVSHLKYCRQRANALGVLGLAALLAWRALPATESKPGVLQQAYTTEQRLVAQKQRWTKLRNDLSQWVAIIPRQEIERTSSAISSAGSSLESIDISATAATFFIAPPRIDHLLQAAADLSEHPLPPNLSAWSRNQFDDVAALLGTENTTRSAAEIANLNATRTVLEHAGTDVRGAAIARHGIEALNEFDNAVTALDRTPPPIDRALADQTKHLVELMKTLGMTNIGALELAGEARGITKSLRDGSLSVLGFTVPGLVVRVLVPMLALGIAIDLLMGALRARTFARMAVAPDTAALVFAGFPWRVTPTFAYPRRLRPVFIVLAPVPVVLSLAAIVPLTLAGDKQTALIGLALLFLAICTAVAAIRTVAYATGGSSSILTVSENADLQLDLAKEQLDAVNSATSLLLLGCVTALSFFLAFLLVPRPLLFQGDQIATLLETRNAFDRAYVQRLREQPKTYSDWCDEAGCSPWVNFGFAADAIPEGHPAALVLKALWEQPIVRAEMPATDRVKDLVTESHALLPDLDQDDLGYVREILYRQSFAPVVDLLGDLQRINAGTPLPSDVLDHLPDGVKQPPSTGMTVPFAFPYRTMVERGGFADRLASLPGEDEVQAWFDFMKKNGLERVRGFDVLAGALADLNTEIGKTKFKIAGVEVERAVAGDAALIVLSLLTIGLAVRLHDARVYMGLLRLPEAALAIERAPGLILVHNPRLNWCIEGLAAFVCCTLPGMTAAIVLSAPADSATTPVVRWLLLLPIFVAVAILAVERQRLVVFTN